MTLYFLRHGAAVEREEWPGDEPTRPLTGDGEAGTDRTARFLAAAGIRFDAIVTSPYARALRTAEIVADILVFTDRLAPDRRLEPGFGVGDLTAVLADCAGRESVLLVGHEPDLSSLVGALIGGGRIEMKKGALACVKGVTAEKARGELAWLLPPVLLARKS